MEMVIEISKNSIQKVIGTNFGGILTASYMVQEQIDIFEDLGGNFLNRKVLGVLPLKVPISYC